ncbi:MAG: glycosyltransferase [Bacteroidia bacterium]
MGFILGYHSQITAVVKDGEVYIPNDVYLMSLEFLKEVKEVKLFLNVGYQSNRDLHPLPKNVSFVNLGRQLPMWRRMFGDSFAQSTFIQETLDVDAILIQGPTPSLKYAAKYSGNTPKFFLLVGTIMGAQKNQYRPYGYIKHLGINLMVWYIEWSQKKVFKKGIVLANNHQNVFKYAKYTQTYLVSKSLVSEKNISPKKSLSVHSPAKLLYYGRVAPDKHIETIFRACSVLKSQGFRFMLQIVGDEHPGYRKFLDSVVQSLDLKEYVIFTGKVDFESKDSIMKESDCLIFHTCGTEGFPRVIWEAFANGIPVLAAEYPGAQGYLESYENVILYERQNYRALSAEILTLMGDLNLRKKLISNGRDLVQKNSLEKSHKRMIELIKRETLKLNYR